MDYLKIDIKNTNLSEKELYDYTQAANAMLFELNNNAFWNLVEMSYDNMTWKNGYSFQEYKNLILSGKNIFENMPDKTLNIQITKYYSFKNTVGYTKPSTVMTWINRKFIGMRIDEFAGHIYHEHCGHNFGFDHPNSDRNSLVYQTGYLMRDCVRGRFKMDRIIFKKPWYRRLFNWIF